MFALKAKYGWYHYDTRFAIVRNNPYPVKTHFLYGIVCLCEVKNMLQIGERLQEYRKNLGLSQEKFAEEIGVSRQAVSKWELDKAYPDLDRLVCICGVLDVSIEELIYGKQEIKDNANDEASENDNVNNILHMKNIRGTRRLVRLKLIFYVLTIFLIFCLVILSALLTRNEWTRHVEKNENVRVEKVYQQYTKADLCYFDENGRKIMNTVWLDVPGIRDGDYVECYTGADNDSLFLDYNVATIITSAIFTVLFVVLLILTGLEIKRMKKEDRMQIILKDVEDNTASEQKKGNKI